MAETALALAPPEEIAYPESDGEPMTETPKPKAPEGRHKFPNVFGLLYAARLDSKAEAREVHRRAEAFMRDYGLKLKTQSRSSERRPGTGGWTAKKR